MKILKHRKKEHSTDLYDSATGKDLKTARAVDVTDELPPGADPLVLLYTKAKRGEIVQLRMGSARTHYFMDGIRREDSEDSNLNHFALWARTTRAHLIELCLNNSPFQKATHA